VGVVSTNLSKVIRTAITYFPSFVDRKADFQRSARRLFRMPFERDFRALEQLLRDNDLCLDVGANRGQSIDALKMLSHSVRITAFEPQPDLYSRLVAQYSTDPSVEILPFGAGATSGESELYVPYYNGYKFDGLASLFEDEARDWLRTRLYRFDDRKLEIRRYKCRTILLDEFEIDGRVAFIKLDIQGGEYDALQGAAELLRRDRPILLIESPSVQIETFLAAFGYTPHAYACRRLVPNKHGKLNTFFLA